MRNMSEAFIRELPERPISEVFAYRRVVEPYEFKVFKSDPGYLKSLKHHMARALAEMIVDKCQLFELPSDMEINRGVPIQMECTINDRGTYENWLPVARGEGWKEGRKHALESLPYGVEPGLYYE